MMNHKCHKMYDKVMNFSILLNGRKFCNTLGTIHPYSLYAIGFTDFIKY